MDELLEPLPPAVSAFDEQEVVDGQIGGKISQFAKSEAAMAPGVKNKDRSRKTSKSELDFEVSTTPQKKTLHCKRCKVLECNKLTQSRCEGFCRAHYKEFLIVTGQCETWVCVCGQVIASVQTRCGKCHRWKDGLVNEAKKKDDQANSWECLCGEKIEYPQVRCGKCFRWGDGKYPSSRSMAKNLTLERGEGATATENRARGDPASCVGPSSHHTSYHKNMTALTQVPPNSEFQIASALRRNEKGRLLCKIIGCTKLDQFKNDGFCRTHFRMFAISDEGGIMLASRSKAGEEGYPVKATGDDRPARDESLSILSPGDVAPSNNISSRKTRTAMIHIPPNSGVEIAPAPRRNGSGRLLCKVVDCPKLDQFRNNGFCRTHFNMCAIVNDGGNISSSWTCVCGDLIPGTQKRCGGCNKWKGGKREPSKRESEENNNAKRQKVSKQKNGVGVRYLKCKAGSCPKIVQANSEGFCRAHYKQFLIRTGQCDSWDCVCGQKIASFQARCGMCHRWREGKNPSSVSKGENISRKMQVALTYVPPNSGVQISSTPRRNEKGRLLCKVIGCSRMDQLNNDRFCRTHFKMFALDGATVQDVGSPTPWVCVCGHQCEGIRKRCGKCNKWRGGKRDSYTATKTNGISEENIASNDDPGAAFWKCDCGTEVPSVKSRCGRCHHWRGGRRQGGWKLGSARGGDEERDDGIDRTKDWTCCGMVIHAKQTRCGKCNKWRGGKRIASKIQVPWECGKCRYSNTASTKLCGFCWTQKGLSKSTPHKTEMNDGSQENDGQFLQEEAQPAMGAMHLLV